MAGAASQAGDADASRAPGLTSSLQGSVNVHHGALLLVPKGQCISSFVFYIYRMFTLTLHKKCLSKGGRCSISDYLSCSHTNASDLFHFLFIFSLLKARSICEKNMNTNTYLHNGQS